MARLQGKGTSGWVWVLLIILAIIVVGLIIVYFNPALLPIGTPTP